jgi:hypothetical protein
MADLYKKLFALKKANSALWNANWGARMIQVPNNVPTEVLSFVRQNERDKVFAVLNFSDKPQTVKFEESLYYGEYADYFTRESIELLGSTQLSSFQNQLVKKQIKGYLC